MSGSTIAVLFGIAVAFGYGLADFWAAKASKKIGPVTALVAINTLLLTIYLPLYFFLPESSATLTPIGLGFAVAGGVFLNFASILFFKGLASGPVSIVSPISAAYPLVSALLAVLVFGAELSTLQISAIIVIVAGVMAASGLLEAKRSERRMGKGPILAVFSIVFYGLAFSCLAQASQRIGWQDTTLIEFVVLLAAVLASTPFIKGKERVFKDLRAALRNRFVIWGGIAAVLTIAAFNMGFTYEQTSGAIVIAVSACYPVITVALALKHFSEEIKLIPLLGASLSIAGVVILSVG